MTQTHSQTRHTLRQRAQIIVDALKAAAVPETYAEIIRAARAVMAIDKMLKQLWPEDELTGEDAETSEDTTPRRPLNRQQRRAQEARQRAKAFVLKAESRLEAS